MSQQNESILFKTVPLHTVKHSYKLEHILTISNKDLAHAHYDGIITKVSSYIVTFSHSSDQNKYTYALADLGQLLIHNDL